MLNKIEPKEMKNGEVYVCYLNFEFYCAGTFLNDRLIIKKLDKHNEATLVYVYDNQLFSFYGPVKANLES